MGSTLFKVRIVRLYVNPLGRRVYRPIASESSDEKRELIATVGLGVVLGYDLNLVNLSLVNLLV